MTESVLILLVALAIIAGVALWVMSRTHNRERSVELRERFGPEYDNAVERHGSVRRAERELARRAAHVQRYKIRPLSRAEFERFSSAWAATQKQFVDDPVGAIRTADQLIKEVMEVRGYRVGDFDQRVADVSVDHGRVVQHYRAARALMGTSGDGPSSTEDLRQAMIHIRALFQDLLEVDVPTPLASMEEARA